MSLLRRWALQRNYRRELVFVSSEAVTLKTERKEARDWLWRAGTDPFLFEHATAPFRSWEPELRRRILSSDLFVLLLGARYGSPCTASDAIAGESFVEWEYRLARARAGSLQIVACLKDLPAGTADPEQNRFRQRITRFDGPNCRSFADPKGLISELSAAVSCWRQRRERQAGWDSCVTLIALISMLATLGLVMAGHQAVAHMWWRSALAVISIAGGALWLRRCLKEWNDG